MWIEFPLRCVRLTDSQLRDPPAVSGRFQPSTYRNNRRRKDSNRSWRDIRPDRPGLPQQHRATQGQWRPAGSSRPIQASFNCDI